MNFLSALISGPFNGWLLLAMVVLVGIFFVWALWLSLSLKGLRKNIHTLFAGKKGADLESLLLGHTKDLKALDQEIQELYEISNRLRELALKSIHKASVLRFNPFKEVGGNQSFSIALLDGKNDGMVISSLHTREGTRVYAKPIMAGVANGFPLTDEEKQVIREAITAYTQKK
jgi:hypothetical protein